MNAHLWTPRLPSFHTLLQKCGWGPSGIEEVLGLGELSASEKSGLEKLQPELKKSIDTGISFCPVQIDVV